MEQAPKPKHPVLQFISDYPFGALFVFSGAISNFISVLLAMANNGRGFVCALQRAWENYIQ